MFAYFETCCGMKNRHQSDMEPKLDSATTRKENIGAGSESDDDENLVNMKGPVQDSAAKQQCLHVFPEDSEDYKLEEKVGEGGFGAVYKGSCPEMGDQAVAVKVLDLDAAGCDLMEVFNEVKLMCHIKHPNILDLHAAFPTDDKLWIVMPYVRFGSVRQILDYAKPLAGSGGFNDEKLIAAVMKQALQALAYCHSLPEPIIHRDVKSANILINETGHCLLMDLGVSKSLETTATKKKSSKKGELKRTNSYVGTASWMAPEVAAVDENTDGTCQASVAYGTKADIWSFGITLLEMAYGCPPHGNDGEAEFREFTVSKNSKSKSKSKKDKEGTASFKNLSTRDRMNAVQHGPVVFKNMKTRNKTMSKKFLKVVEACLQIDPDQRPTAQKLLKDSFFKSAKDSEYIRQVLLSRVNPDYLANGGKSTPEERTRCSDI
jgi:serine/threonine-protein kinase OSR1/STK39